VTLASKTFGAGMEVIEEMVTLSDEVTVLLTEGAPRRTGARLAPEWISGALAHTMHTEVMAGRGHLLDTLSEYMSYVVLAPYLGPEQAAQTIVKARRHAAATAPPSAESVEGADAGAGIGSAAERLAKPPVEGVAAERLAASPVEAHLGEVGQHDAHQEGDHDDDYQRSLT
jgi:hypothetical protein